MAFIKVSVDLSGMMRKLDAAKAQMPFATALALTNTAKAAKQAVVAGMAQEFESVTSYTRGSITIQSATKSNLVSAVYVRGGPAGAVKWLRPEIYGGPRQRALELILAKAGLPPPGMYAVPGKFAKLRGGKVDIGWLASLVAVIAANGQSGATGIVAKRRNARKGGAANYFVLKEKRGRLLPGIYGKTSRTALPYIIFVRQPTYRKKFNFYEIAEGVALERFPIEFEAAVKKAMATVR